VPVLDDEFLATLFTEAGDAFAIPASGGRAIVRAANGDDGTAEVEQLTLAVGTGSGEGPPPRTFGRAVRAHRLLAVAACLLMLVGLAAAGIALRPAAPGRSGTASVAAGPSAPATTLPVVHGSASPSAAPQGTTTARAPQRYGTVAPGALPNSNLSAAGAATNATAAAGQATRIEQTGSLELQVGPGALSSTLAKLTALAAHSHGFVANSQSKASAAAAGRAPSGSITLQIPESGFPAALKEAQALGKSLQLTTKATDVTGNYVDLQSRITALQASRQQYLTIMAKASSISDILAVQAQLDSLQSQIEQLQGQLALLTSETTYATLTVVVHEPAPDHPPVSRAPAGLDRAWHDSVHGFVDGVDGLVGLAGPALFALLCAGLAVLAGRLLWRRWQRHNL
jgi:hypothetical protein